MRAKYCLIGALALAAAGGTALADPANIGKIIITEILPNPLGSDVPGEWLEIYNPGLEPVDVTGWRLADEDGESEPLPAMVIQPGEAWVIVGASGSLRPDPVTGEYPPEQPVMTPDIFQQAWGTANVVILPGMITIANSPSVTNEIPSIIDLDGDVVDVANYEHETNGWPATPQGATIQVLPPFLDSIANDRGCAWSTTTTAALGAVVSSEARFQYDGNGDGDFDDEGDVDRVLYVDGNIATPGFVDASTVVSMDCNGNGRDDSDDICTGSTDCDSDGALDECQINAAGGTGGVGGLLDLDNDGQLDACQIAADPNLDCNVNGVLDTVDIARGDEQDVNGNGIPDGCDANVDTVIITEIMFDPFSGTEMEYVEILNLTGAGIDLSNWRLQDVEPTGDVSDGVPPGTVLGAGEIAVLCRGSDGPFDQIRADYEAVWGTTTPDGAPIRFIPLSNWGARANSNASTTVEILTLIDGQGYFVDQVNYVAANSNGQPRLGADGEPWPGNDGHSALQLRGDRLTSAGNDSGASWILGIEGLDGVRRSLVPAAGSEPAWSGSFGEDFGSPGYVSRSAPQQPGGEVIITEIMAATNSVYPGDEGSLEPRGGRDEFIEIYNTTGASIDLSGWYLQDEDGRTTGIPAGTTLAAGDVAILIGVDGVDAEVCRLEQDFYTAWGCGYKVIRLDGWYTTEGYIGLSRLADGPGFVNEILRLVKADGTVSDIVNYDDDGIIWPNDTTVQNADAWSIYLLPGEYDAASNDLGLNWAASTASIDGAVTSNLSAIYNSWSQTPAGRLIGSPGFLEGVTDPVSTVCCAADRDASGTVDVFDLLDYLNAWFAGDAPAEQDCNGTVDVFDLLDYLDDWFMGC